ncbi:MAG TPA: hypothetical protein DHV08_16465 [Rhodocyclaceae bacterium]|nr:hypothetical protein [Rhodocyclaceae bacterium]
MCGEESLRREEPLRRQEVVPEGEHRQSGRMPAVPRPAPLDAVAAADLAAMREAAAELQECRRVLTKAGLDVVSEVLRGQGDFVEYEHYPHDDVFDADSHAQYYYHAHRGGAREHGHFHTFLRAPGMPPGTAPVENTGTEPWPQGDAALSHLVAISMDAWGEPLALFAVNRWVTGDAWYRAGDVVAMLDRFGIDHAWPSWPVNRWITAMLRLFRPEIETLLRHRDRVVELWAQAHPGCDVFEDRRLEVTGSLPVSIEGRIRALDRLRARSA